MATAADKRKKLAGAEHQPASIVGVILKCSVCVLLLVLLLAVGMQIPEMSGDTGQLAQGSFQHWVPYSFYAM